MIEVKLKNVSEKKIILEKNKEIKLVGEIKKVEKKKVNIVEKKIIRSRDINNKEYLKEILFYNI